MNHECLSVHVWLEGAVEFMPRIRATAENNTLELAWVLEISFFW